MPLGLKLQRGATVAFASRKLRDEQKRPDNVLTNSFQVLSTLKMKWQKREKKDQTYETVKVLRCEGNPQ